MIPRLDPLLSDAKFLWRKTLQFADEFPTEIAPSRRLRASDALPVDEPTLRAKIVLSPDVLQIPEDDPVL